MNPLRIRWGLVTFFLGAIILGTATASCSKRPATSPEERILFYQSELRSYAEALPLGTTREEVETYLREHKKPIRRMCCIENNPSDALDVLTKIGEEPARLCGRRDIFVGFQFKAAEPSRLQRLDARDSDVLTKVTIFSWSERCM